MQFLLQTFNIFIDVLSVILSIRVVMSWLLTNHRNMVTAFIWDCTEPVLHPIRNLLPAMRVDFSPVLLIWVIRILQDWFNSHF